eukprot:c9979_g1_i1.p1 GENE.c9979_g1_i1~~c9979_g1_i1.p1  ORF type:complete len:1406 (+),score=313.41 c9979_g1_i1:2-4219(+)
MGSSKYTGVFTGSSPVIIFLFFFFFGTSIIGYCFLLSSFFSRAKVGGVVGVIVFFGCYFGSIGTSDTTPESTKNGLCLLSPLAFALGINALGNLQGADLGVSSGNMNEVINNFKFGTAFGMLIFDSIFYTFLGWYLHKVVPREWGVTLPWYFPCMPSFWCGTRPRSVVDTIGAKENPNIEPVNPELEKLRTQNRCIEIIHLTKEFHTPTGIKVAVNDLNLTLYEGQIFALLGHNGAGKTTTINIMSGMLPMSAGKASVLGYDVHTQMPIIRRNMGVCPQHNVLYPELTVEQHLAMFGRIKGLSGDRLTSEVRQKIEEVGLTEKANVMSKALSGGMKRKLSLAIAFIGDSKVVFLDEPTSGMDPYSRRFTWDVIKKNKAGRIIVLTTHFMDEADLLADRIGIMGEGALRCCGSSLFLKTRFGQGYHLTVTKTPSCNDEKLNSTIMKHVPGAKLLSDVGTELTFQLPVAESGKFASLFSKFDERGDHYGVQEYGVSITTMEEIFIRVARGAADEHETAEVAHNVLERRTSNERNGVTEKLTPATPIQQMRAVYTKRALVSFRDCKSVSCSLIVPILLVILGLCLVKFAFQNQDQPEKELTVQAYGQDVKLPYSVSSILSEDLVSDLVDNIKHVDASFVAEDKYRTTRRLWGWNYTHGIPCPVATRSLMGNIDFENDPPTCAYPDVFQQVLPESISPKAAAAAISDAQEISRGWREVAAFYGSVVLSKWNITSGTMNYLAYFNTSAHHAPPTFINAINSAAATAIRDSSISISNWPFPPTDFSNSFESAIKAYQTTTFVMIAIAFIPAGFVAFIVRERQDTNNAKHLQMLSGCEISTYWAANYLWDFTNYLPFFGCVVFLIYIFDVSPMVVDGGIGAVAVLFLFFGLAIVPFTYFLSYGFKSPSAAQIMLVLFNFVTGLALSIVAYVMSLDSVSGQHVRDLNKRLKFLYRIFPGFCVGDGLYNLAIANMVKDILGKGSVNPWDWDICGANVAFLIIDAVAYSILTLAIDFVLSYPKILTKVYPDPQIPVEPFELDVDVAAEEARMNTPNDDAVQVVQLRKVYRPNKVAVHNLQFGIPRGQCFGLLGINGAGKTTTLKILTGDVVATSGSARLAGLDVMTQLRDVRKVVGYCPQFDGLTDLLTVREHLEMYCRLRGIRKERMDNVISEKLAQLDLKEFENRLAGTLSGGNKRKLSVAIATVGSPPIMFLDEPSTGMDPVARRFMWKVIADISTMTKESTVILTTHSMEECEALCTQVAIMVGGRFRCLGNVQRLKARFGQGFTVEVKLGHDQQQQGQGETSAPQQDDKRTAVVKFFQKEFPEHQITESTDDHLIFKLTQKDLSVARVFDRLEHKKEKLGIQEYSVSQTTLEQIFNSFASQQEEERAPAPGTRPAGASVEMQPVAVSSAV